MLHIQEYRDAFLKLTRTFNFFYKEYTMGGFVIQHNLSAMNAQRQYGLVAERNSKSAEKLASGYKVNRAADDAASLAISEKMRRQIRGLRQAEDNIQDGISFVQVADGALNETHDLLQRMNELCVKGANDTLTDADRSYINMEIQAIKEESDRIFATTSFNDRYIWNVDIPNPALIGYAPTQALNVSDQRYGNYPITGSNKDYMPIPSTCKVSADDTNGIKVSWTGFDGNTYATDYISWDDLEASNYDFSIADHLPASYSDAVRSGIQSFFSGTINMNVISDPATIADYVTALNNASISIYYSDKASGNFDVPANANGITISANIKIYAKEKSSTAGTDDAYNFASSTNDDFIEPALTSSSNLTQISGNNTSDIDVAKTSTTPWIFKFNMSGVGGVTATSASVSFYSYDERPEKEKIWWSYNDQHQKVPISHSQSGNLAGVMKSLTGSLGVLTEKNQGDTNSNGNITINFNLVSNTPFSYNGVDRSNIGNMYINIPVSTTDTESTILAKVNSVLKSDTVLDLSQNSSDYMYWYSPSEKASTVDVPIYGGQISMIIQSGADPDDNIPISYEKLNNGVIGIRDLEITTSASARLGIDTIKNALNIISKQRSNFGAQQNKLAHAYLNDNNTRINTQDAESKIRDTNMASEMVKYSLTNILKQAGQSIMAQANQTNQGVMSLLQ